MVGAGTAREIIVNDLQLQRLTGGRLPDHSGDDLLISVAIQHLYAGGFFIPVRSAGKRGSVQSGGVRRNGVALIDQSKRQIRIFTHADVDSHVLLYGTIASLYADIECIVLDGENGAYGLADTLDLHRTGTCDLIVHKGKGLDGVRVRAGAFRVLTPPDGVGVVGACLIRIRIEGAAVKCHIRAGCPHPAAQGRRIPTPVTAGHTGPALQGAAVIRADRVVRPYKAEQEPCKYGKAPLQLCRRGASAYTQSSMLLRSTATSKGAAVASLI